MTDGWMDACMHVYMSCMYAFLHVCMHACMYVCKYVWHLIAPHWSLCPHLGAWACTTRPFWWLVRLRDFQSSRNRIRWVSGDCGTAQASALWQTMEAFWQPCDVRIGWAQEVLAQTLLLEAFSYLPFFLALIGSRVCFMGLHVVHAIHCFLTSPRI